MSNLLKEWNRIAFGKGSRSLNESQGEDPGLAQLEDMGMYFAGSDTVIVGDLEDMSSKRFRNTYPCDDPMEQGPFHFQVSIEKDGTYRIYDYTSVIPDFVTDWPIQKNAGRQGTPFRTIEEVKQAIGQMVISYEEFMEVYDQAVDLGAITNEFYPYLAKRHPAIQKFKKH